jgi:two-component sensor histidine kinase
VEWRSLTEDAELIVSELTTNALRADCAQLQVSLELHRTDLVVTVVDDAVGWPQEHEVSPADPSGRGLHIVGVMSAQWGSAATDSGKQVWARLPVPDSCTEWVACEL